MDKNTVIRIGIDAIGIENASGGRTATLNLLCPLFELDRINQYTVAVSSYEPKLESSHGNVEQWVIPVRNRFLKRFYAQATFPFKMRNCDLVHFTKNLSLVGPMPPKVVTVFDLTMLLYPQLMAKSDLLYWQTMQRYNLREARCIITISNSAANDISHFYNISRDKIRVIYPGVSTRYCPSSEEQTSFVRKKYHLPEKYIIHVGRIDPIKNLPSLVAAFAELRKQGAFDGKLLLVGQIYKKTPDNKLLPTIEKLGLTNEVILAGYQDNYITDEDLPAVLSGALFKVFPSLNEGFGLAPLEAMACGIPVIASRAGSLQEVLGDAAILLEKNDVETLFKEMRRLISDNSLRKEISERGIKHAKQYNWYESARKTLQVYQEIYHR